MTTAHGTRPVLMRRIANASLLAAVVVAPTIALVQPAIASAEAREWDIGAFDACMNNMQSKDARAKEAYCCEWSGGVWNSGLGKCVAPPANATGPGDGTPTRLLPPGAVPQGNPVNNNDPGTSTGGQKPVTTAIGSSRAPTNPTNTTGTNPSGGLQ
jgi:hypothetical protein